jgi:hypothetical protein
MLDEGGERLVHDEGGTIDDRDGRLAPEPAREHRQTGKRAAHLRGKERRTPLHGRAQRTAHAARPRLGHVEEATELGGDLFRGERGGAGRGDLDGQGQALESPADAFHGGPGGGQVESAVPSRRAIREECDGRRSLRERACPLFHHRAGEDRTGLAVPRNLERPDAEELLVRAAEGAA